MASCSGTVIYVTEPYEGCNKGGSGYGNYCIIDHGNGYSTLYGHARDIYVSEGQWVEAGQSIGVVRSTGTSTGAHLHFPKSVSGARQRILWIIFPNMWTTVFTTYSHLITMISS